MYELLSRYYWSVTLFFIGTHIFHKVYKLLIILQETYDDIIGKQLVIKFWTRYLIIFITRPFYLRCQAFVYSTGQLYYNIYSKYMFRCRRTISILNYLNNLYTSITNIVSSLLGITNSIYTYYIIYKLLIK